MTTKTRLYSRVILTLDNVLLSDDKITNTPALAHNLDLRVELELRSLGCERIQIAGMLLDLPQMAMATGQVLFQRFYYCKSFVKHSWEIVAMACIALASKIEEAPRRIRDVISVFNHIKQVMNNETLRAVILDQKYIEMKNQIIKAERRLLKVLGFCVHVKHPHKMIILFLRTLNAESNHKVVQRAWNYMNDSLRTDVFVRYTPESIACACIFLAARDVKLPLPNNPHWFCIFGVTEKTVKDISRIILSIYLRPKPNVTELESTVKSCRDELEKSIKQDEKEVANIAKSILDGDGSRNSPAVSCSEKFSPGCNRAAKKETSSNCSSSGSNKTQEKIIKAEKKRESTIESPRRREVENDKAASPRRPKFEHNGRVLPPRSYDSSRRRSPVSHRDHRSKRHSRKRDRRSLSRSPVPIKKSHHSSYKNRHSRRRSPTEY